MNCLTLSDRNVKPLVRYGTKDQSAHRVEPRLTQAEQNKEMEEKAAFEKTKAERDERETREKEEKAKRMTKAWQVSKEMKKVPHVAEEKNSLRKNRKK